MDKLINIARQDGVLVVSSREVAKNFGKNHRDVLEGIDQLIKGVAEKSADLFYETTYIHRQNKQEYREILMNRDGFSLLVMGFTGQKALDWKLKYIDAFNRMEQALTQQIDSYMISNPVERAKAWIQEEEKRQLLISKIKEDEPKVLFAEAVEDSKDVILVKEMATILTQKGFFIGQNQLFEYLRKYGYLCKRAGDMYNLPTKKYEHLFKVTKRTIHNSKGIMVRNTPKVTGRGQLYFIKKFAEYKSKGMTIKDLLREAA